MSSRRTAARIVEKILDNLSDRNGFDVIGEIECSDPDVYEEMIETLEKIVLKEIE